MGTNVKRRRPEHLIGACIIFLSASFVTSSGFTFLCTPSAKVTLNSDRITRVVRNAEQPGNSSDQLVVATETPGVFVSAFAFLTGASSLGLLFGLYRLLVSFFSPDAADRTELILRDLAPNALVTAVFALLAKYDYDREAKREANEQDRLLGEALPSLPVQLQSARTEIKNIPGASRVMLCVGSPAFCNAAVDSAASAESALARAWLYVVPIPLTLELVPDEPTLEALGKKTAALKHVAVPQLKAAPDDWEKLCQEEFEKLSKQGIKADFVENGRAQNEQGKHDGIFILFEGNRLQKRFLGDVEWNALSASLR
jgi:hypothetical protein